MEADEELENDKLNDDNMEIGGNVTVCKSESKSQNDNNDSLLKDHCETNLGINQLNQTCLDNCDSHNYADKVNKANVKMDNKLNHIPTVINKGHEYVIFDEELLIEWSRKWELSACGLKHILNNGNEVFVFKFDNLQGLNTVIESGPWIVNNKPMVVQKWDPSVNLDRNEPKTLPLWIKLMNPSLEA
ncbi:zinc knuckle CX2CX4HX4C containing protein [Tanacetum coccineum]